MESRVNSIRIMLAAFSADDRKAAAGLLQDEALRNSLIEQIDALHYFKKIIPLAVCAAVACHGGPNAFGLFTVKK